MKWLVTLGTENIAVDLPDQLDGLFQVKVNTKEYLVEFNSEFQMFFLLENGSKKPFKITQEKCEMSGSNSFSEDQTVELEWMNFETSRKHFFSAQVGLTSALSGQEKRSKPMPGVLKAHMAGNVLKILVTPGTTVKKGEPLMVLEAMKMENLILSFRDGIIARIDVQEKQAVTPGQDLLHFSE